MILLSFDTEEFDVPREHGVDFPLDKAMEVSVYGTNKILDCLKKNGVGEKKEFTGHKRVCGNCTDVCPNRANVLIEVPELELLQILHVDYMCNECGNCRSFCQYAGAPYKDKFTLFATEEDMEDSTNNGFTVLDAETKEVLVRIGDRQEKVKADQPSEMLSEDLGKLMCTVIDDYTYLLM